MPAIVWKGFVSFGLVSFPVRLSSAARAESIHFHMLHRKDLSRVKEVWFCAEEDKPIEKSDIVKGFEVGKDEYVVVEPEELKKIAPSTASTMEIIQFVAADEVDPLYFESSYYVAPEAKLEKPYALFRAALEKTGQYAIAKLAMHAREHVVLMRPSPDGIILHTLYYSDELHKANIADAPKASYSAKELDLAKSLIEHLTAPFKPAEFEDSYKKNVQELIEQKQKGQTVKGIPQKKTAPVIDLMEALQKSLQSAKQNAPASRSGHRAATSKPAKRKRAAA